MHQTKIGTHPSYIYYTMYQTKIGKALFYFNNNTPWTLSENNRVDSSLHCYNVNKEEVKGLGET